MQVNFLNRTTLLTAFLLMGFAWLVSLFLPFWVGLLFVIAFLVWRLSLHYRELKHFSLWLTHPTSHNVPSGHGVWTNIFAALYALRRTDEAHESKLALWLERFQNTMCHLPDGIVLMNLSTQLEWCNPIAQRHFGLALEDDKGNRMANLVRLPALVAHLEANVYDAPIKIDYLSRRLEITVIPFEENSLIVVSRDITEAERMDEMRRDFIANASHELRTPLTVISGFLEYASDAELMSQMPPEQRMNQVNLMCRQAEHMTVLIQDMLMLSRLESDFTVDETRINMPELIESILPQIRALPGFNHTITTDVATINLKGSMTEISSAVTNLLSNAVRYTPTGGLIHLSWHNVQGLPTLSVQDSGAGIAPEHLPRLTERFYRVNNDASASVKGTGLGLAIVKHILIRHQAELKISSTLGKGTTFSMVFPAGRIL
jgi:two-component system, OmpR family, phosphate regulon sensor histidine kinase PhoR